MQVMWITTINTKDESGLVNTTIVALHTLYDIVYPTDVMV